MPITQVNVSLNEDEENQLTADGFTKVEGPLNNLPGNKKVYFWYKEEARGTAITRIQFSYSDWMARELRDAMFSQIQKNVNTGKHGSPVYMWYCKGSTDADVAIQDFHVSNSKQDEAKMVRQGWERLTCDLNQDVGGDWAYLWVKRVAPVFISDLTATSDKTQYNDLYQKGYTRLDEYTNKFVEEERVYIWYRNTTDSKKAIENLKLSNRDEKGCIKVNMDLNMGTGKDPLFLWYNKGGNEPIRGIGLIIDGAVASYEQAGAVVIKMSDASSSTGSYTFYLCFYR